MGARRFVMEDEWPAEAAVVPQPSFSCPSLYSLLYVRKLRQQKLLIDTTSANSDFLHFASQWRDLLRSVTCTRTTISLD